TVRSALTSTSLPTRRSSDAGVVGAVAIATGAAGVAGGDVSGAGTAAGLTGVAATTSALGLSPGSLIGTGGAATATTFSGFGSVEIRRPPLSTPPPPPSRLPP